MSRPRIGYLALLLGLACALLATQAWSRDHSLYDSDDSSEDVIKAGFIFNFAKFVNWPSNSFSSPDSPIVIGILGKGSLGPTIDQVLNDKKIAGRKITVRQLKWGGDLRGCNILIVSPSESQHLDELVQIVKALPVLTIGEMPGFAEHGGVINLVFLADKIHFEINVEAAKRADLDISSRLLSLARIVHGS